MIALQTLPSWPTRFVPSKDVLSTLNERTWICSYSGGKDSTSLVTYIEWLRRIGLVKVKTPRLTMSDTTVEYPFLRPIADNLMGTLTASGWECQVVTPRINEKLYNRIFGIGNTPVHPGGRQRMRWCTRATKIDPMKRLARGVAADVVQLSGVRWGESDVRDGKLKTGGCAAGGECGLPDPGEGVYGPIITWKTCKVVEWLSGEAGDEVNAVIADMLPMMRALLGVYEVKIDAVGLFQDIPPKVTAMRFGCIGCPAISNEKITKSKQAKSHPEWIHLRRIYGMWDAMYANRNRCCRTRTAAYRSEKKWPKSWNKGYGYGPLRMDTRQRYFPELLDIQDKSGVVLVNADDIAFIHDCWERKVYPRGWGPEDELIQPPEEGLFANVQ